ncbi:MAG: DsrE family protein [Firmicutes bacterium]|nr:DsrE family protein [Clostridiales bacterium]MBQ9931847.1 DsrE family protein [Bacillota bacterium]
MTEKLTVIWTSGDKEVALHMAFMYARNAKLKGWWKEVDLVIWGPSDKLAAEDPEIQEELKLMQHVGVNLKACITCAMRYGVVEKLQELGVDVIAMGPPLTEELKKEGSAVLTI